MRASTLCVALTAVLSVALTQGQTVVSNSELYTQSLATSGLPNRVGNGFYTPRGCSYVADYNGQCGGSGAFCNPASGVCADAQYPGICCPVGYACQRLNPQYWQCTQSSSTYKLAPPGSTPLQPFDQCGGTPPVNSSFTASAGGLFVGTACPDGYSCTQRNVNYSQCTPNPQTIPEPFGSAARTPFLSILQQITDLTSKLIPTTALAPGLQQYTFVLPGDTKQPDKTLDVTLNITKIGEEIDGLLNKTVSPPSPPPVVPPPPPPPTFNFTTPNITFAPRPPLTITNSAVTDTSGNPVTFHGFNWFGFEIGQTMVDGLYQNYLNPRNFSQVGDFSTIVYRQQALGFNAVRLPFRFADLNIAPPNNFTRACSADSQQQIIGNLTNPTVPYYKTDYANTPFPPQTAPILPPQDVASSGLCNGYLPNDSTLNRFLYVIQFYIGNGFYVAIDFHGQGEGETDRQIVANSTIFQSNWLGLLTAIQSLPKWQDGTMKGRLIFDLLNEPDAFNFAWSQGNNIPNPQNANSSTVPSWGSLYTSTAALLTNQEPALLFFAEGTGQSAQPGTAYGMGFGINPSIYTNTQGLYNALGGLQILLGSPAVKNRTIITPHCYPYQVTKWTIGNTNNAGLGLPYTYFNNYAYLSSQGVPDANGVNQTFPIAIGEFGNVFNSSFNATVTTSNYSDPLSDTWAHDFAEFANNLDATNATRYPHKNISSTFWWDWNANSAPPLGLVNADPGNVTSYTGELQPGWLTIQWIKINNITDVLNAPNLFSRADAIATGGGFGLRPWYLPPTTH